jgi:hypothetical protein
VEDAKTQNFVQRQRCHVQYQRAMLQQRAVSESPHHYEDFREEAAQPHYEIEGAKHFSKQRLGQFRTMRVF